MIRLAMQTADRSHLVPQRHGFHACVTLADGTAEGWHYACPWSALALATQRARLGWYIRENAERKERAA